MACVGSHLGSILPHGRVAIRPCGGRLASMCVGGRETLYATGRDFNGMANEIPRTRASQPPYRRGHLRRVLGKHPKKKMVIKQHEKYYERTWPLFPQHIPARRRQLTQKLLARSTPRDRTRRGSPDSNEHGVARKRGEGSSVCGNDRTAAPYRLLSQHALLFTQSCPYSAFMFVHAAYGQRYCNKMRLHMAENSAIHGQIMLLSNQSWRSYPISGQYVLRVLYLRRRSRQSPVFFPALQQSSGGGWRLLLHIIEYTKTSSAEWQYPAISPLRHQKAVCHREGHLSQPKFM